MGPCKGYIYAFFPGRENDDIRHDRHVNLTSLPVYIYFFKKKFKKLSSNQFVGKLNRKRN